MIAHVFLGRSWRPPIDIDLSRGAVVLLERGERRDQLAVVDIAFFIGGFDAFEDLTNRIYQPEERTGSIGCQSSNPVPQQRQQTFADMRNGFELGESEETAGSFDGVDAAEDPGEQ